MPKTNSNGREISLAEFEALFESLKNWGKWGKEDVKGTLNYITPEKIRAAGELIRSGLSVSMAIPMNTVAGPDNPVPVLHYMNTTHDIDIGSGELRFATDFLGIQFHGDCHTHIDALCHIAYRGQLYNGQPANLVTARGALKMAITDYAQQGVVGRGVLIDIPRLRGIKWLEPGEIVYRDEIEAAEKAEGVQLGEGDIMVFRTGHHRRRLELGAWNADYSGEGRAGIDPYVLELLHERKVAAFLPDGDGEVVPGPMKNIQYPIHPLQIVAMGMICADSLNLEELAQACEKENRWEFMVVIAPLRLPKATGSPFNPIAIF